MNTTTMAATPLAPTHELRFESLFRPGRGYSFPCDAMGQVDIGGLNERERGGYLRARSLVGRELTVPMLLRRGLQ